MTLDRRRDQEGNPSKARIGLFDSGAGGLSVLRHLVKVAGDRADFVYLADTARCPYGNRPAGEISLFAEQTARWLCESDVDNIIMACNTSASTAGAMLRSKLNVPVHDLIKPVSKFCAAQFKSVAVFATAATCRSGAFSRAISSVDPSVRVLEIPCPELVPLVESGRLTGPFAIEGVRRCLDRLKGEQVEALILGCTHFPFLADVFRELVHADTVLIDPAEHLHLEVFSRKNCDEQMHEPGFLPHAYANCSFFTTGDPDIFARTAERCLGLSQGELSANVCGITVGDFASMVPILMPVVDGMSVAGSLSIPGGHGTAEFSAG